MEGLSFTSYRQRSTRFTKAILHDWFDDTNQNLLTLLFIFRNSNPVLSNINLFQLMVPIYNILLHLIEGAKGTLYRYTLFHSWKKNYERIIRSTKTRGSNHDSRSRKSGSPLVREAKFPYCRKLIQAGCNIYAFQQGFSR